MPLSWISVRVTSDVTDLPSLEAALTATLKALGRVDIAWLNDTDIAVSWIDRVEDGAALLAMRVTGGATTGEPVTIAEISKTRSSGVPQMVMVDGKLVFAWTRVGESTGVELATLDSESL